MIEHLRAVVGIGEAIHLGLEGDVEAAAPGPGVARADLRRALVGRDDPRRRIVGLQHLPAQRSRVRRPVAERTRQQQVALQEARRQALDLAREILPVVVV